MSVSWLTLHRALDQTGCAGRSRETLRIVEGLPQLEGQAMITTLTIMVVLLALLNAGIAYRTYLSQTRSEKLFGKMTGILNQVETLQTTMNARELHFRQERARTAVHIMMKALRRQADTLDGQWIGPHLPLKADPLEPVRVYENELAWIPTCGWKEKCIAVLRSVGPVPPRRGEELRTDQRTTLSNGCSDLEPAGQLHLYEDCLKAIDEMD